MDDAGVPIHPSIHPATPHIYISISISFSISFSISLTRPALAVPVGTRQPTASFPFLRAHSALPLLVYRFLLVCHAVSSLVTRRDPVFFPALPLEKQSSVPIERSLYHASVVLELQ